MTAAVGEISASHASGAELIQRIQRYRRDPWLFLSDCVYTLDEADQTNPIKKFPSTGPKAPYLKLYTRIWQRERYLIVPKSRRMFMTWINVALYTHDSMFNIGRSQGFMSKKEEDADELLNKSRFILEHIPEDKFPKALIPKFDKIYCKLTFPELNSVIRAFPQGADQMRMHTLSGILADEMAFWEKAQETYAASIPTLEGGGRFTGLSSPAPGFFKAMVFDQIGMAVDAT